MVVRSCVHVPISMNESSIVHKLSVHSQLCQARNILLNNTNNSFYCSRNFWPETLTKRCSGFVLCCSADISLDN